MGLNKSQKTGILGGILVFLIPLIIVTFVYTSKKPKVDLLPYYGEHVIDPSGEVEVYHSVQPFEFNTIGGKTINNDFFRKQVRIVRFGEPANYEKDYQQLEPLLEEFKDFPELQFVYHLRLNQNNSFATKQSEFENWHVVARSDFRELPTSYLLENGNADVALVDRKGRIRGLFSFQQDGDMEKLAKDIQYLLVENLHQTKKYNRSDRFSREQEK